MVSHFLQTIDSLLHYSDFNSIFAKVLSTQMYISFQKHPQQFLFSLTIFLVSYRQIHPCFLIDDTTVMAEGLEAGLTMISAHAALSHAAEGHGAGGKVDDGVIDTTTSEMAVIQNTPPCFLIFAEKVQCQGMRMFLYAANYP